MDATPNELSHLLRYDFLQEAEVRARIGPGCGPYVYVLHRANYKPFYVGKGSDNFRALEHALEARRTERLSHKLNLIRAMQRSQEKIRYTLELGFHSESEALERERMLINEIGRHDLKMGPLTNQTDGGEGTSNPSEESRQKRRDTLWGNGGDDEERKLANRWFQEITEVRSVPIKSLGKYRVERLYRNRDSFKMSERQAGALAASAIANRVLLEPGALIPRRLKQAGVDLIIENGVGRDVLSSEMASLAGCETGHEILRLSQAGYRYLVASINASLLVDAGILDPDAKSL